MPKAKPESPQNNSSAANSPAQSVVGGKNAFDIALTHLPDTKFSYESYNSDQINIVLK